MKTNLYTVFDSKANAYLTPFYLPNDGLAMRAMQDCVNDKNHKFYAHAADFTLFKLGEFDDLTAKTTLLPSPQNIVSLLTVKSTLDESQPMLQTA